MPFPNWIVGVLLACMASVISNLGLNLQKVPHVWTGSAALTLRRCGVLTSGPCALCPQLNHLRNDRAHSSSGTPSRDSSQPASPFFPPYTIPRSPPSSHKSLSFFRQSTPPSLQLKEKSTPSPVHPSYQSASAPPSPTPQAPATASPLKVVVPPPAASSPSHPLLSPERRRLSSPSPVSPVSYHRQSLWRIGLSLVVVGSFADFIALIFAAQSIIAPLGSLTLVSNTVLAPFLLKESVTGLDVLATVAIVIGSSLSVACADHRDRLYGLDELFHLFVRGRFLAYVAVVCGAMFVLYSCIQHIDRIQAEAPADVYRTYRRHHRFCFAALAGIVGAQSVLFAKCVGTLLVSSIAGDGFLFFRWQTYAIFLLLSLTVTAQIHYLNEGLRQFTSTYVIPVYQSFWILTSVLSGMVFFNEWRGVFDEVGTGIGFPLGVLLTVAGVYVLSKRGGEDEEEGGEDGEQADVGEGEVRVRKARAEMGRLTRAATQPLAGEINAFPSASSSSFFLLGFDGRRGGRVGAGPRVSYDDDLHTAPVQSSSSLYMPLSASVPSTFTVPETAEEVKESDERHDKRRHWEGGYSGQGGAAQA